MGLAIKKINGLADFDLDSYLSARTAAVDRALAGYLKRYSERSGNIWKAMHYGLFPGGKRIRPILVLAAGELFGAKRKALMPFACAVEMIHGYSLIHDDLPALDNDDLRRGAPTNHKVFGEGMALLAGDGLLTEAFHVMSGAEALASVPAELVLKLVHELSHAVGVAGLVGGQAFDLEAEKGAVDIGVVEYIHLRKTGALIRASVRLGAQVAGASAADLRRVTRFGDCLGLAFQIADDILDILGETAPGELAESGHSEWNKATYPSVVGIARAQERLKNLFDQCLGELARYGKVAEPLRAIAAQVAARALQSNGKSATEEIKI
ncbi:MAG: Polyprenyl synthetase family protein [Deltaproteobacteria bacterium]|nr:Polyprenyl synthetase family protein [Deltaproteobacteria bacterium]